MPGRQASSVRYVKADPFHHLVGQANIAVIPVRLPIGKCPSACVHMLSPCRGRLRLPLMRCLATGNGSDEQRADLEKEVCLRLTGLAGVLGIAAGCSLKGPPCDHITKLLVTTYRLLKSVTVLTKAPSSRLSSPFHLVIVGCCGVVCGCYSLAARFCHPARWSATNIDSIQVTMPAYVWYDFGIVL